MTTTQHKIGSGFGFHSTADEVLRGIDLSGKLAIVTGGYSGLGLETTRALVAAGARVIVPARRRATAQGALAGMKGVEVAELDLSDLESVREFAERFIASGRTVDLVI
jgi:NAD(P)-dependent dehydrogenase (short-subunit alcohol dehydrogenase family)